MSRCDLRFCCLTSIRLAVLVASLIGIGQEKALAFDLPGVLPMALDQPQINAVLIDPATGLPLTYQDELQGETTFNITAFYDTGASGILLSSGTAEKLNVLRQTVAGSSTLVQFYDVGVGGSDAFNVSTPIQVGIANYLGMADPTGGLIPVNGYQLTHQPVRLQVGLTSQASSLLGDVDVFGMPLIENRVVVIDPKPLNGALPMLANFGDIAAALLGSGGDPSAMPSDFDSLHTQVYEVAQARQANSPVPTTNRHVRLTYASFAQYTRLSPNSPDTPAPTLSANPFIGSDPLSTSGQHGDNGVTVSFNGHQTQGSWLLDTGAAISMLSSRQAANLGIIEENGQLVDAITHQAMADQFTATISGVGGSKTVHGFYLDTLTLPTVQGDPIRFVGAPVFVADISVQKPGSQEILTLDGILGMNYLVASTYLDQSGLGFDPSALLGAISQTELDLMNDPVGGLSDDTFLLLASLLNGFGGLTSLPTQAAAFDWIVIDNDQGLLGLDVHGLPEPTSLLMMTMLASQWLSRHRRRYA